MWFKEFLEWLSANWVALKGNWVLFLVFAAIVASAAWQACKFVYAIKERKLPERKVLQQELEVLQSENENLREKLRDLTTTQRMLGKEYADEQGESISQNIANALK